MKVIIEIEFDKLKCLDKILSVSTKDFESEAGWLSSTYAGRILEARQLLDLSLVNRDCCFDFTPKTQ